MRVLPSRCITVFCLCLVLSACANIASYSAPAQSPATVEDISVAAKVAVGDQVLPKPDQGSIQAQELPSQVQVSPVVRQLMASAEQRRGEGDPGSAANSLERALRIEPRNAILWSRLADIRFDQGNWQQAIQLAAKSNTLAGNDKQLRRRNWYLMANAYATLDNPVQAQKYRDKLRDF